MAYDNAKLIVYSSLTKLDGIDPPVSFTVQPEDFIDWKIDAKQGAADDIFEIYGRKATLRLPYEGEIAGWIAQKTVNARYPEYMDAVLVIADSDTNIALFKGALRIDNIKHDYDKRVVEIILSDALDIWITQAKKWAFTFNEEDSNRNSWGLDSAVNYNNFSRLLWFPVQNMALGLDDYEFDIDPYGLPISDQELILENYDNDFSTREYPILASNGQEYPYIWKAKLINVVYTYYDFRVIMYWQTCYDLGLTLPRFFTRCKKWIFPKDNLFQPSSYEADSQWSLSRDQGVDIRGWLSTNEDQNTPDDVPMTGFDLHTSASYTDGANTWTLSFIDDKFYVDFPFYFRNLLFKNGAQDYTSIALALITANLLYLYADNNGTKRLVNSLVNPNYELIGGMAIPDTHIINQQRSGLFGDLTRVSKGTAPILYSQNLINALNTAYQEQLAKIACKLSFSLPDYYYSEIDIFDLISIDGYTYIVTLISSPNNGIIDVDCAGEWN